LVWKMEAAEKARRNLANKRKIFGWNMEVAEKASLDLTNKGKIYD
jgi:hypothetical protein